MPNVLYSDIFEPLIWSCKSKVLLQLQLFQWFQLAFSLREAFVLWWHPAEHSNFAFSTAWDFIKIFEVSLEKVTTCPDHSWQLAVNLGFSLPVHSHFCPDPQFMLDTKRSELFPYLFLLVLLFFLIIILGAEVLITPFLSSTLGQYSKKENRGFAAFQGLISYCLMMIQPRHEFLIFCSFETVIQLPGKYKLVM